VAPSLQDAFANFIEDGHFASNIRKMTRIYRSRRDALVQQLANVSGNTLSVSSPAGGMQLLAYLDQRYDDQCFVSQLAKSDIIARPLSRHYLGKATAQGLFLGFATWNEKEIEMGVQAIGKVVRMFEAGRSLRRARS
jgi:GntR family transcriptional regulator/MocR family aminotransferase